MKGIVAVFAHPDDETFICGGTLARCAAEGARLTLVCATLGEMGRRVGKPPFANRETLPALRRQELFRACQVLGIKDVRLLGFRDKTVEFQDEAATVERIAAVLREVRPAAVITFHERAGGHPDHNAIGRFATLAWQQAGGGARLYFVLGGRRSERLKSLGLGEDHVTRVDVSAYLEQKMHAYRAHRSQSEMYRPLWRRYRALKWLSAHEDFVQGSDAPRPGETHIL